MDFECKVSGAMKTLIYRLGPKRDAPIIAGTVVCIVEFAREEEAIQGRGEGMYEIGLLHRWDDVLVSGLMGRWEVMHAGGHRR
jgi:hypothetical protein